ncbi:MULTISPECIES: hypothetical protein [unclassified Nocardioides]|uniref:hypothetical protein n=1 Tax=unclassified Nocardioides TaxID=2615069 RepID=UPI0012E3BE90|nr:MULTISPECIES: hypothetical protein [unclassified Nocardioides]
MSAGPADSVEPPEDGPNRSPRLVADAEAPVTPDLELLAKLFVRYAVGDVDSFPHRELVSLSISGQVVASVHDIGAALVQRTTWKVCPEGWTAYGASLCPVDLLGPIDEAAVNDDPLVYTADYGDVICAPTRSGPSPRGRLVVLRPVNDSRTCASDFALVLVADVRGRLRSVDLTLSEP